VARWKDDGGLRRLSARELVDAVEAAGLAERRADDPELRAFLADLGYDPLLWIRARVAVKRAQWFGDEDWPWDYANVPLPRVLS
jgi:hypothetical protein